MVENGELNPSEAEKLSKVGAVVLDNASGEISQLVTIPDKIQKGDIFIFSAVLKTENKYTGEARLQIDFLDKNQTLIGYLQHF